jgi:hypothetical protein
MDLFAFCRSTEPILDRPLSAAGHDGAPARLNAAENLQP